MFRWLSLAVLGLAMSAGLASANGIPNQGSWFHPGFVGIDGHLALRWGHDGGMYLGHRPNVKPYQLGPWYQYWPYEAHFQQPAMPQYPFWGAQTLPHGSPVLNPGYPGHGAVPPYWGGGG